MPIATQAIIGDRCFEVVSLWVHQATATLQPIALAAVNPVLLGF
jgi:hypothetical protein